MFYSWTIKLLTMFITDFISSLDIFRTEWNSFVLCCFFCRYFIILKLVWFISLFLIFSSISLSTFFSVVDVPAKRKRIRPPGRKRVKLHICTFCDYRTLHVTNLKHHIRTHTGEKPFFCQICYRCFMRKDHLKSHMMRWHKSQ